MRSIVSGIRMTAVFLLFSAAGFFPVFFSHAQMEKSSVGVASTHVIVDDEFYYGDIIVYDKKEGVYTTSKTPSDASIFGIAVEKPALVFITSEGGVPIIQTGRAIVNVTTVNGSIEIGDYITSSFISGKGQKASKEDDYVVGVALNSFNGGIDKADESAVSENDVFLGKIVVLMSVGKKDVSSDDGPDKVLPDNDGMGAGLGFGIGGDEDGSGNDEDMRSTIDALRFLVAAFIAIGSIFIALKNFMSVLNKSIISVGRNPLARASVWSMIIFNTIVAVLISVIGIFLSMVIITLPL